MLESCTTSRMPLQGRKKSKSHMADGIWLIVKRVVTRAICHRANEVSGLSAIRQGQGR
jgi:hypothetical protein